MNQDDVIKNQLDEVYASDKLIRNSQDSDNYPILVCNYMECPNLTQVELNIHAPKGVPNCNGCIGNINIREPIYKLDVDKVKDLIEIHVLLGE